MWPNLNSNWKNQTSSFPLVLPASGEVNLKVNHGDIRITSQALPMPRATPEQREAIAVAPLVGGRKRLSAQECAPQPTRHPWQLHAILHQQQQYLITYAASSASHWTNNDPLDQGRNEAGQLPVEFFPAGWPGYLPPPPHCSRPPPKPQPPPTNAAEVKAAVGVEERPAVNTPDRHPQPLEHAREKRRERLAHEESQRNRDLPQSVQDEDSASRCELEHGGASLVCEKVVAECDWHDWDEDIPITHPSASAV